MKRTALLIIDLQNGFFRVPELASQRQALITSVNRLVGWAYKARLPIWNIRTVHRADKSTWTLNMLDDRQGYLLTGHEDAANLHELRLPKGAHQLVKTRDSAFIGTNLATKLHQEDIETIILCGVSTHSCVAATAIDAYARNLRAVIARDAVATNNAKFGAAILEQLQLEYRQQVLSQTNMKDWLRA